MKIINAALDSWDGFIEFFFRVFFFVLESSAPDAPAGVRFCVTPVVFFLPSYRVFVRFLFSFFETKMTRPLFGNGIFDGFRTRFETVYFETLFFCFSMEHFLLQNAKENICEHETCYSLS